MGRLIRTVGAGKKEEHKKGVDGHEKNLHH